jgi:hypothetical protein
MALTYLFLASPGTIAATQAGKVYTANAATGVITAVAASDALTLQAVNNPAPLLLLLATGATADRPNTQPATALTGALNNLAPLPLPGTPFYDTTLSKTVYFVGSDQSSTGWVDQTGAAA